MQERTMKTLALIPLLLLSASVFATETSVGSNINEPIELKSGAYLFISNDNIMRMVDNEGKPVQMTDGVEMELINGDLIMMKNKRLWHSVNPKKRHDHQKMK